MIMKKIERRRTKDKDKADDDDWLQTGRGPYCILASPSVDHLWWQVLSTKCIPPDEKTLYLVFLCFAFLYLVFQYSVFFWPPLMASAVHQVQSNWGNLKLYLALFGPIICLSTGWTNPSMWIYVRDSSASIKVQEVNAYTPRLNKDCYCTWVCSNTLCELPTFCCMSCVLFFKLYELLSVALILWSDHEWLLWQCGLGLIEKKQA